MARQYWADLPGGRHYFDTAAEVKAYATRAANKLKRAVKVGYDEIAKPAVRKMRQNPWPADFQPTGELWKITVRGPRGQVGHAYANSEKEAYNDVRLWRARGYHPTHILRLAAPTAAPKKSRRGRAK